MQVHSSADVGAQPQEFTLGLADGYQHNWEIYLKQEEKEFNIDVRQSCVWEAGDEIYG